MQINYGFPGIAKMATAGATITTSEAAIMTITDGGFLRQSQLTVYLAITLGSATSVKFRYYYSPDGGTTYFQVPVKNDSSGLLADIPSMVDSTSPTQSGVIKVVEDIPYSGSGAFKVTAQAVGASATLTAGYIYVRDN